MRRYLGSDFLICHGHGLWAGRDKRLVYAMLLSTGIGMMLMTCILTAEMLIEGQKSGRLTWPYGDLVPGNYLVKAGLPAFCVMVTCCWRQRKNIICDGRAGAL